MAFTKITTNIIEDQAVTADKIDISTLPAAGVVVTNNTETGDVNIIGDIEATSFTVGGGAFSWNAIDGTVDLAYDTVTLQIGQEQHFYAKASEAISNGDVIMFTGAQGDHMLVAKANIAAPGFSPEYVVGVATSNIANNEFGYITSFGKVRGLNTSGYNEGDILYLDPTTPGALTTTRPSAPTHVIQMAAVLSSNPAEGVILVRPTHFPDTDEVPEGVNNLYYTDQRVSDLVTTNFISNLIDATNVDYDNTVSGISANTVQEAIDYLNTLSGGSAGDVASYTRQKFTATEGQTTFTLTDGYTLGYLEVFLNGVLLDTSDYTANDESTVVLTAPAKAGDEIITIALDSFAIAELLRVTSVSASADTESISIDANSNLIVNDGNINVKQPSSDFGRILLGDTTSGEKYLIGYDSTHVSQANELSLKNLIGDITFHTSPTGIERARIDTSGNLLVGKTSDNPNTQGVQAYSNGILAVSRDSGRPLYINRNTTDGALVDFVKDGSTIGSIGNHDSSSAYIGSDDTGLRFNVASNSLTPYNPATKENRSDAVDLGFSTIRFKDLYLSGGVHLGGTGTANKLDDYETGTWTPYLAGATGITYNYQFGYYVKVGKVVTVHYYIDINTAPTAGSNINVPLPFAPNTNLSKMHGQSPNFLAGLNLSSTIKSNIVLASYAGTANFYFYSRDISGDYKNASNFTSGLISGTVTYQVD